jgi:5-methylcytosine-specific restriction protein A
VGTFILTWNPENWLWTDLAAAAEQTAAGSPFSTRWSTGNTKRIGPGDRVFLLKQGAQPRGIMAAGDVTSETYLAPHYDRERAAQGDEAPRVNVDFERILDPSLLPLLSTDNIGGSLGEVYWAMPASGFQLPDAAAQQLETAWKEHLRAIDDGPDEEGPDEEGGGKKRPRNPDWERDELILALALYFRHRPKVPGEGHPDVIELSELLNALPIHAHRPNAEKFRNPNGVSMKLSNFLRFDPSYQGKGLLRGNRLEREVWDQFADNPTLLREVADAIRAGYSAPELGQTAGGGEVEEEEIFPEGRVLFRLHRARERNRNLVRRAKARAMRQHGRLFCCVCTFDFAATYGAIGEGFIECHHTRPLSELVEETVTRLSDLALVCSNCHRMIHRKRPWPSISQLAEILRK